MQNLYIMYNTLSVLVAECIPGLVNPVTCHDIEC